MKQIFGYTPAEINEGEQYVKFFQAFKIGSDFELRMRDGAGKQTSLMVPAKQVLALSDALRESGAE